MKSIEPRASGSSATAAPEETYEDVRQSFLSRLHREAARLAFLGSSLQSPESDTASVFGELEEFAHRLRGAAAVFEAAELSADAKSLELAVAAASNVRGRRDDRFVLAAVRTLTVRLALLNGTQPAP